MDNRPKVSIIMPCYNHGDFIEESINSVLNSSYSKIELIIINDGSTDEKTNDLLANYKNEKVSIISTKNKGVVSARNTGIEAANGKYILPLDADDKIYPLYIEKAVEILENNQSIGIVYCMAEFIGTKKGPWKLPNYSFPRILSDNLIFVSAIFKKSSWENIGGFKQEMKDGLEDYEFWISLIEKGETPYRIPEILFQYQQHQISRNKIINSTLKKECLCSKIIELHQDLYLKNFKKLSPFMKKIAYAILSRHKKEGINFSILDQIKYKIYVILREIYIRLT